MCLLLLRILHASRHNRVVRLCVGRIAALEYVAASSRRCVFAILQHAVVALATDVTECMCRSGDRLSLLVMMHYLLPPALSLHGLLSETGKPLHALCLALLRCLSGLVLPPPLSRCSISKVSLHSRSREALHNA